MELCGISTGKKELIVGGLLANVGIGIVLPILSSSLATGLPVLISAGASPAAFGAINGCNDSSVEHGFAKTFS